MKTPNFVLNKEYTYYLGIHDSKSLPEGSFVNPITSKYVPKHVLEDKKWAGMNENTGYVFCYTRNGILPIPVEYLREV